MPLYLLDKNVVEDIKDGLAGRSGQGERFARAIDKSGNTISPILAIMESGTGQPPTAEATLESMRVDSQAVGLFYTHARTDSTYFAEDGLTAVTALAQHMRDKTQALMPLANELRAVLWRTFSLEDAWPVVQKIDDLARHAQVSIGHPLVACAIACLYGHEGARDLLKPAKTPNAADAYNPVVDIRLMMETAYIRELWNEAGSKMTVRLYSQDRGLNEFSKQFNISVSRTRIRLNVGEQEVMFSAVVSDVLLPNLQRSKKQHRKVMSFLKEVADAASPAD
ncbi:hypothetical protein OU995_15600 [Roseateles sp. SL47]|uniref:hypothetical protein n=1 Tax=Roseateles sp. SL47 TaxID=2995138 RepID=UPI00227141F3|nr:hypothetical protein [Roseateles sp. SL47]WAC71032.1 hypothetical protein OU995_15600 [Roseateles sp. SL47]